MDHKKIAIIGAGISGLTAAKVLEAHQYAPVVFEASSDIGGRVQTDIYEGYQLDRGFQVLLTGYPAAQKYLAYPKLEMQTLKPGAVIYSKTGDTTIGDPSRDLSLLLPTILSNVGSISDKWKVLKLNRELKNKSLTDIFQTPETTTKAYLETYGFSQKMIAQFFKPFFSGIFLEDELQTSSRMFEFVYKMFGEGATVIPKAGIGAIPKQLAAGLHKTSFKYNTRVRELSDAVLVTDKGEKHYFDYVIVATEASALIANLSKQTVAWKSCDTLYFEAEKRQISQPIIGLISDPTALTNNLFYHSSIDSDTKGRGELLSVTVVKSHHLDEPALIATVTKELRRFCGIEKLRFLKRYQIPKALPSLHHLQYEMQASETRLTETIFLAGDHQLNGSLNAAMIAGEKAALGVIERIGGLAQ